MLLPGPLERWQGSMSQDSDWAKSESVSLKQAGRRGEELNGIVCSRGEEG